MFFYFFIFRYTFLMMNIIIISTLFLIINISQEIYANPHHRREPVGFQVSWILILDFLWIVKIWNCFPINPINGCFDKIIPWNLYWTWSTNLFRFDMSCICKQFADGFLWKISWNMLGCIDDISSWNFQLSNPFSQYFITQRFVLSEQDDAYYEDEAYIFLAHFI